jgi:hypothetical protein
MTLLNIFYFFDHLTVHLFIAALASEMTSTIAFQIYQLNCITIRCWHESELYRIFNAISSGRKDYGLEHLPTYACGISSGGFIIPYLAADEQASIIQLEALALQVCLFLCIFTNIFSPFS